MLRPLADEGTRQAHLLATSSRLGTGTRVLSSPARRCVDTVAPLARRLGVTVEIEDLLYEDNGAAALGLLRNALGAESTAAVVACTHGDVLPALLNTLAEEDGLRLPADLRCEVASSWVIDWDKDGQALGAEYHPVN